MNSMGVSKGVTGLCQQYWLGEQGWRSGKSTHLPLMWPRIDSRILRHMWIEFVGSVLCSERFFPAGYSGFPLSSKNNICRRSSVGWCAAFGARGPQFDPRWLQRLFPLSSDPCSYSFKYLWNGALSDGGRGVKGAPSASIDTSFVTEGTTDVK